MQLYAAGGWSYAAGCAEYVLKIAVGSAIGRWLLIFAVSIGCLIGGWLRCIEDAPLGLVFWPAMHLV